MKHLHPYISYFAQVDFRDDSRLFGIKQHDRMTGGLYLLGKTGSGKTNLLHTLLKQDIHYGRGICLMDVNGDLIHKVISAIPKHRKKDVVYLDTTDPNLEWGYNPLRKVAYPYRHLITEHIIETFQKIWGAQAWGIRQEYLLRNTLNCLQDQQNATFADIPRILTDERFRMQCLPNIISKEVHSFFVHQFPKFSKSDVLPVLNKVGSFLTVPIIKKILVDNKKQLSMNQIMNENKLLLVNLSKGILGESSANLLGSLLLNSISSAGFHRIKIKEEDRQPFFIYLDEFQNFTTLSLVNMFSELRKMRISFIVAHQFLGQLTTKIKEAVLGNIGTIICFRLSYEDAKKMANEMYPSFNAHDLTSLETYHCCIRMLIDGKPTKAFSAKTIPVDSLTLPFYSTVSK